MLTRARLPQMQTSRSPADRRSVLDRVAAVGYALLIALPVFNDARWPAGILVVPVVLVAFGLPIVLRRSRLVLSLSVCLAGLALTVLVDAKSSPFGFVPLAAVLYQAASVCRQRIALGALGVCMAAAALAAVAGPRQESGTRDSGSRYGGLVLFLFLFTVVWIVGYAAGMQRRHTEDLLRDQARLAEVRAEKSRRALAEERMRIARELHDVVAHSMSVITVQATFGALVLDDRPAQARSALEAIESTGRQALTEMRQLLCVLREPEPEPEAGPEPVPDPEHVRDGSAPATAPALTPAPGLADLDRLIRQTAQAGVQAELGVVGRPRAVPPGIDLTAYRIVQEALTNVVKHAATPRARVLLEYRPDELAVDITDEGRGCLQGTPTTDEAGRPCHGLVGMRERALLHAGTFSAGPLPGQGFRVAARLPLPVNDRTTAVAGAAATGGQIG